jgi:hypothetical protein
MCYPDPVWCLVNVPLQQLQPVVRGNKIFSIGVVVGL